MHLRRCKIIVDKNQEIKNKLFLIAENNKDEEKK